MSDAGVYCVIPVHNRREVTLGCIEQLRAQCFPRLIIVVIDDGSTDGTGEALREIDQNNLHVISGDGSLWWGGAMKLGLNYVQEVADDSDFILMLNDDVDVSADFVSKLVEEISLLGRGYILGAQQREISSGKVLDRGYKIDFWRVRCSLIHGDSDEVPDALPGRGLLIPVCVDALVGGVNSTLFPHAFSDLEYSCRAKERGIRLAVSKSCSVLTALDEGNNQSAPNSLMQRIFSTRAKNNIRDQLLFFCVRGPLYHRVTAPLRFLIFKFFKLIKAYMLTIREN